MKALSDVMNAVEGIPFAAELNLATGESMFRKRLREQPSFIDLAEHAKDASAREKIVKRIGELAAMPTDDRYENKFDVALSAYLAAVESASDPPAAAKAATAALGARNIWWSVDIARAIGAKAIASGSARPAAEQKTAGAGFAVLIYDGKKANAISLDEHTGEFVSSLLKSLRPGGGQRLESAAILPSAPRASVPRTARRKSHRYSYPGSRVAAALNY